MSSSATVPACGVDTPRVIECCAAAVSYAANILLISLIVFRTSTELRVYARVLLANCIIDLIFTTTSFVIEVHWVIINGWTFMFHNGFVRSVSSEVTFLLTGAYFLSLYTAITTVTVPFVYRYFLICRNHKIRPSVLLLLVLFNTLLASLVPICGRLFLRGAVEQKLHDDPLFTDQLGCRHAGQIPYLNMHSMLAMVPPAMGSFLTTYTYTVISICSYKIWKQLKSQQPVMRPRTISLQVQLNRMLLVQALSPLFVIVIPLLVTVGAVFVGVESFAAATYLSNALSWIPVISPLTTMYFVKDYRHSILDLLGMRQLSRTTPSSSATESKTDSLDLTALEHRK